MRGADRQSAGEFCKRSVSQRLRGDRNGPAIWVDERVVAGNNRNVRRSCHNHRPATSAQSASATALVTPIGVADAS